MRGNRRPVAVLAVTAGLVALLAGCAAADPDAGPGPLPVRAALPAWSWQMPHCVAYRPSQLVTPEHRRSVLVRDRPGLTEQVEQYEAGWGARAVAEIRAVVRECGRYEYGQPGDPAGFLAQNRVLETGFAGDESLLVETVHLVPPAVQTWYAVVVRHGDRVTTVRTSDRGVAATRCLLVAVAATCAQPRA